MVAAVPRILLVGLGNLPYPATRHSIGQYIVDGIAARLGMHWSGGKGGYTAHDHVVLGDDTQVSLTLFKSKSLMNVSGPSIVAAYRQAAVSSPQGMLVLSDSLDHPIGSLHVRLGGSANGHNGVKSIISALGSASASFYRFRVGIGRDGTDAAVYVMQRLSSHERMFWSDEGVTRVLAEVEKIARAAN